MRDKFKGYYRPTKAEEDTLWGNALIVLDTNVVLDFYRYHTTTTRLYLDSLEKYGSQLWLPYQVALEFHRSRPKVRAESSKAHRERIKELETFKKTLSSHAHKTRLTPSAAQDDLLSKVDTAIEELSAEFDVIRNDSLPKTPDKILDRISALFNGRVGEQPTPTEYKALEVEGEKRFDASIPPGYEDRGQKPAGEEYGDYFLWQQLMDHAKTTSQDIIFATEDAKSDWSWKVNGDIIGPRPELIQEFREKTGQDIIIYSGREFFRQLSDRAKAVVNKSELAAALADVSAVSDVRGEEYIFSESLRSILQRQEKERPQQEPSRNIHTRDENPVRDTRFVQLLMNRYARLAVMSDEAMEEIRHLRANASELDNNLDRIEFLHSKLAEIVAEQDMVSRQLESQSSTGEKGKRQWTFERRLTGRSDEEPGWSSVWSEEA